VDVGAWLRGLGLERYERAFRDAEVTPEILPELTEADLRELGLPLGPRKAVLKAIRDLAAPTGDAPSQAERRQLTVLFADLVGSTALSASLDPEDMREVIRAYQDAVAGEVARLEGVVAKFMGDGVLAYFGFPQAHEDDAERAVRAGLAIVETTARLRAPGDAPLAARVGIATGLVVVGDLVGSGPAREHAVVGETPNLAARLQTLAEPGTVVIAEGTRRLVGGLFEYADLGRRSVKGFAEPVPAWRALGPGRAEGRFWALRAAGLTPLVGRERELALLLDRWRRAEVGEGQVVLLAGEPGIGKSRIVEALRERLLLDGDPPTRLRYFCSPYHQNSALHPVIDQLARAAGLERDDPGERKLDKLEALLARSTDDLAGDVPLVAALLGLPIGARHPPPALSPQRQRERTLEALVRQLEGLARGGPALVVWEDAHWADPTSLELLGVTVDRVRTIHALVVITFRPEFMPPWPRHAHLTALTLDRLGRREAAALAERSAGGEALPAEVLEQILARTDGVPLFVEELTKAVLEAGPPRTGSDRDARAGPLPPVVVPATLHDALMARLDRLGPVKPVAQVAAAIGREFPHGLLAAVARLDEPSLDGALSELSAAGLVFPRGAPPAAGYAFKHALVRDAAYAGLLRDERRRIHGRIAMALLGLSPDGPPEVMAHHLTEAGQADPAAEYWARAGQEAVSRAAGKEAVAHFRRALAQLLSLPDTAERKRREAALQGALGGALVSVDGPASETLERAYARTRDLCEQIGDTRARFVADWNLWHVHIARAEYREARALADRLVGLAEREDDPDHLLQALHLEWSTLGALDDHGATRACCERGWALYDPARHGGHHLTYGAHDPGVCSRVQGAFATWVLGGPDRARACYEQGLALARRLNHPQVMAHALVRGLLLLQLWQDEERLAGQAEAAFALAAEQGFADYRVEAQIHRAWALGIGGEPGPALRLLEAALRERHGLGSMWNNPFYLYLLARAQARAGALDEALATVERALEYGRSTGRVWMEPEHLRIRGEFLAAKGDGIEAAERSFGAALARARATSARAYELRSATSLARLWVARRQKRRARDLLAPVHGWFTEGFDTPDLRDAAALLDELR
jgi:predicted ATPase/class 3 adenylate cyclase